MDRKRILIVILVLGIICIPTVFVGSRFIFSSNLIWGVEVGDIFTYDIAESGWEYVDDGVTFEQAYFSTLDTATIIATIIALPELGNYYTAESFLEEVVLPTKVSLAYENGSELLNNYTFLVNVVSLCVLPIGSWALIDEFYQDTSYLNMISRAYFSKQEADVFRFGYHTYDIDLDTLIEGELSYDTGIPSFVYYERIHGVDFEHEITLGLLNP